MAGYLYNGNEENVFHDWLRSEMKKAPKFFQGLWIKSRFKKYLADKGIDHNTMKIHLGRKLTVFIQADNRTYVFCRFEF